VLFCQPAGNDGNENKELRPVFSGVPYPPFDLWNLRRGRRRKQ
jgi:hypothetical protein